MHSGTGSDGGLDGIDLVERIIREKNGQQRCSSVLHHYIRFHLLASFSFIPFFFSIVCIPASQVIKIYPLTFKIAWSRITTRHSVALILAALVTAATAAPTSIPPAATPAKRDIALGVRQIEDICHDDGFDFRKRQIDCSLFEKRDFVAVKRQIEDVCHDGGFDFRKRDDGDNVPDICSFMDSLPEKREDKRQLITDPCGPPVFGKRSEGDAPLGDSGIVCGPDTWVGQLASSSMERRQFSDPCGPPIFGKEKRSADNGDGGVALGDSGIVCGPGTWVYQVNEEYGTKMTKRQFMTDPCGPPVFGKRDVSLPNGIVCGPDTWVGSEKRSVNA